MSGNGRKTPPLVADKRTRAAAKPTKGRTPTRGKVSKRGKAKPTKRTGRRGGGGGRGGIIGFFRSIFRWIFRLLFKAFAAGATVVVLIVGIATYYFYSTLPPLEDLLDGRTRGSVTMLDRYGEVFAWRGDQFGGQVTAETVAPEFIGEYLGYLNGL